MRGNFSDSSYSGGHWYNWSHDGGDYSWVIYHDRLESLPMIWTTDDADRSWVMGWYYARLIGVVIGIQLPASLFFAVMCDPPWSLLGLIPWAACAWWITAIFASHRRLRVPLLAMAATSDGLAMLKRGAEFRQSARQVADSATDAEWQKILEEGCMLYSQQQAFRTNQR